MSKQKKSSRPLRPAESGFLSRFNFNNLIIPRYRIIAVIIIIFILFLIFLNPLYFGGKTFYSGDILSTESMQSYVSKEREGFSLWNSLIFCGMPAYAISTEQTWFNLIYTAFTPVKLLFVSVFSSDYAMWTIYLILLGITSYFFMYHLTKNVLVSLFTAIATAFSTGIIVNLFIGHVTKLTSLSLYPLIFLILFRFQERIRILDFFLLVITLQMFVQGFHVQIIFYTAFAVAIYFIYYITRSLVLKDKLLRNNLLKSAGIFLFAGVIAVLIQSDHLTQMYEYTPYSTRGTESLLEKTSGKTAESESAFYEYHTNWSFSPGEVLTFFVPSYFGFGNSTYKGPLTNNQPVEVNTYFGQMPLVDAAQYMGILILFLALFAVFTRWKEPIVQFLAILSGIALLISFGKNFPVLFDILFYNLPYFDKFRVPSMILHLIQLSFPVLAGLGLLKIISLRTENKENLIKVIKNTAFGFTGLFVLALLLSGALTDWFSSRVNDYAAGLQNKQLGQQFTALSEYMSDMFFSDLLFAAGFLAAAAWLANIYLKQKISADFFVLALIIFLIIDLWRIDSRGARYVEQPDIENIFNPPPDYVTAIRNINNKEPFRILNLKQDGSPGSFNNNSNFHAYYLLEDFYGYSGAKPRAIQDIVEIVGPVNTVLWRMMNVKYIITGNMIQMEGFRPVFTSEKSFVYENQNVLPRAYLVNRVEKIPEMSFLNMVKNSAFDPKQQAYVHDIDLKVDPVDSAAAAMITGYTEDRISLDVKTSGNNFLFLSSTYLPGWKCTVDGKETTVYKANHGYLGAVIPAGVHKVEFRYAPESFFISKYISLILSGLVILGFIISFWFNFKNKSGTNIKVSLPAR